MIDLAVIDEIYEATKGPNGPMQCAIFDKRVLLPLVQLPSAVHGEATEAIDVDMLRAKAAAGWFPLLENDRYGEGVPLYVPSRIGLFLKLEREGYGADELRVIAELEEWAIDNMYTVDDLAYVDDDLDALIQHLEARVAAKEHGGGPAEVVEQCRKEAEAARKDLVILQRFRKNGVPEKLRPVIDKAVFRARAFNDMLRTMMLDMDRAKVRSGYSPYVDCRAHRWNMNDGFNGERIMWDHTIRGALSYAELGDAPPIRVPGFVLRGELVTPTRTLRPTEYSALWKQHELDKYLAAWSEVRGDRRCLNCFAALPAGNERKRFCGDKCRNAARQRRFRERNPEAVERAQKKYWDSIELEEE